jgi:hypothetical protein
MDMTYKFYPVDEVSSGSIIRTTEEITVHQVINEGTQSEHTIDTIDVYGSPQWPV